MALGSLCGIGGSGVELEGGERKDSGMQLNLPVIDQLMSCKNLLIAGMGGGFDVFCGLPIYFELQHRGQRAHLASFSFSSISRLRDGVRLTHTLVGVTADNRGPAIYFPELYLAQWFREERNEEVTIWCFEKTGPRPLLDNYRALVERLGIDGILVIDGGVDSLMRGDEAELGTLIEDASSLAAVDELEEIPLRMVACLGFGAEQDVTYAQVFENIAALAQAGGVLGSCSLARQMEAYQLYEDAVRFVHNKPFQPPSVINASVISAVQGHFGDYHLTEKTRGRRLWISPLMPIYWFFDLPAGVGRNLFFPDMRGGGTFFEGALSRLERRGGKKSRVATPIPPVPKQ